MLFKSKESIFNVLFLEFYSMLFVITIFYLFFFCAAFNFNFTHFYKLNFLYTHCDKI